MLQHSRLARTLAAVTPWLLAGPALAATPESGTISMDSGELSYHSGEMPVANSSGLIADSYTCDDTNPCDIFLLTVDLPADYPATHPQDRLRISAAAVPETADIDLQLADEQGVLIDIKRDNPPEQPSLIFIPQGGRHVYQVQIIPGTPVPDAIGTITLFTDENAVQPPPPVTGGAHPDPGPAGRYTIYQPALGVGESAGEPTIGFNPHSGRAMYIAGTETLRVSFPERLPEPLPEACDALWEDVSFVTTDIITFDPILWTDSNTGRTFVSQLLPAAGQSLFAYTDDDGDSWTPSPATLDGSFDHQTVGSGPYSLLPANPLYPNAVYYCSQTVAAASCIRSDDGGLTFGAPTPLFTSVDCGGQVGALHGHIKVAADGTMYVPSPACGGKQAVHRSEDDGLTFSIHPIPESAPGGSHPSIAIASDETLYFCYQHGDGTPRVAVSHDQGESWVNDTAIGAPLGITRGVFPVAVAGDGDRAACGFLGTQTPGNSTSLDFEGLWYPYVATTYDGGLSWTTENVSPEDPVQGYGGIWEGGGGPLNRNLLDFNDLDIDDQGRLMFAYSDGCTGGCRFDPTQNSFSAKATIARQAGGRRMLAAFDPVENGRPAAACASFGARDAGKALIKWRAPDHGGAPISAYAVYRGDAPDRLEKIAVVGAGHRAFLDSAAASAASPAYYKISAIGAGGEGALSNALSLPVGEIPLADNVCVAPGITLMLDPEGDPRTRQAIHDILALNVAEPLDLDGMLVVTLKIGSLDPLPPPGTIYEARFAINDTNAFFIGMETTEGTPRFVYGNIGLTSAVLATVSTYEVLGDLEDTSGYDAASGTVTLVIDKSVLAENGFDTAPGRSLVTFAATRALTPTAVGAAGTSFDYSGNAAYFFREADCSSLSTAEAGVVGNGGGLAPAVDTQAATDRSRFGGALGLGLMLPLMLVWGVTRKRVHA